MKLIGIAGPSAAGKSTVSQELAKELEYVDTICLDDYYKHVSTYHGYPDNIDFDHPDNLLWNELIENLKDLQKGKKVLVPIFEKGVNGGRVGYRQIDPQKTPIILVEGYLLFHNLEVVSLLNQKIYLEISENEQFSRRNLREGTSMEYFLFYIKPTLEKLIEPTKKHADWILDVSGMKREKVVEFFKSKVLNIEV